MEHSDIPRHSQLNHQVEIPGFLLYKLIKHAASERGAERGELKRLARKAKKKILTCDVDTAVILMEYANGHYHGCGQNNCNNRLVLWEAIAGLASCLTYQDKFKLVSRTKRLRDKEAIAKAKEEVQVRNYRI